MIRTIGLAAVIALLPTLAMAEEASKADIAAIKAQLDRIEAEIGALARPDFSEVQSSYANLAKLCQNQSARRMPWCAPYVSKAP